MKYRQSKSLILNTSPQNTGHYPNNRPISHCSIVFRDSSSSFSNSAIKRKTLKSVTKNSIINPHVYDYSRLTNSPEKDKQKNIMKWIGVNRKASEYSSECHQAFPKRFTKTSDQSYLNFMLKYGKVLKQPKQSKQALRLINEDQKSITNAATVKVKPRLTWYNKNLKPGSLNLSRKQSTSEISQRRRVSKDFGGSLALQENHESQFTLLK